MDINSFSYTGPDFAADYPAPIAEYSNDDMNAEITTQHSSTGTVYYSVWAGSYDGSMDVCETFNALESARALYDHIVTNYSDTPPVPRELRKFIRQLHRADKIPA